MAVNGDLKVKVRVEVLPPGALAFTLDNRPPPAPPSILALDAVAASASATSRPISRRAVLGLGLFTKDKNR